MKKYKIVLNCFDKTFTDIVEDKFFRTVKGIPKPISMRYISVMQLKRCMRKGCILYAIWVTNLLDSEKRTSPDGHPVLNEFSDVFRDEILGLPLNVK